MRTRRIRTAALKSAALAVAALALVTACSSSGPGSGASSGTASVDHDATLRVSSFTGLPTWDPIKAANGLQMTAYLPLVYDTLVRAGTDGRTVGSLATDFAVAADGLSATATIRSGVKFWDGTPLTAEAVKANFERARDNPGSLLAPQLAPVESVTTSGDTGLKWTFKKPNYAFFNAMTTDARLDAVVNPAALNDASLNTTPQGSGPYKLVKQNGDTKATFERVGPYGSYWEQGAAEFKTIEVAFGTDDPTIVNQLKTGQIDVAEVSQGVLADKSSIESAGLQFKPRPVLQNMLVHLNNANPKLADVRVRQAISLAIDRKALSNLACNDLCKPTTSVFMAGVDGYLPDFESDTAVAPDVAKAKQLLSAAGVGPFSIKLEYSDVAVWDQMAQVLQQQLKAVGITLELVKVTPYLSRADYIAGKYDAVLIPLPPTNDPSVITTTETVGENPGKQVPDAVAAAVATASKTPAGPARVTAWEQVNRALVQNPISVPLLNWVEPQIASDKILNIDKEGKTGVIFDFRYLALAQ